MGYIPEFLRPKTEPKFTEKQLTANKERLQEIIRDFENKENPEWAGLYKAIDKSKAGDDTELDEINAAHRQMMMDGQIKRMNAINATVGKLNQPFCKFCMNRGYKAAMRGMEIVVYDCSCVIARRKAREGDG